jgi:predicted transcriptional regulator
LHPADRWVQQVTKLLDRALEATRNLLPEVQDDIARVVLRLAGADDKPPVPLTAAEQAAIAASKAAAARGEFATDDEVRAVWGKHGL